MGSLSRGFRILRASWSVVRSDRELLLFPVLSFVSLVLAWGALTGAAGALGLLGPNGGPDLEAVVAILAYVSAAFVSIFFNAALVGAASMRLREEDPTVRDGLRMAWSIRGKILRWALLTSTVGLLLRAIQGRVPLAGSILVWAAGLAWSVVTFLVVPVLLFEELDVRASVSRSASLFKKRWGEQLTGQFATGLAIVLIVVPVVGLAAGLVWLVSPAAAVVVAVAIVALAIAVEATLTGVFNAALYRYARSGFVPGEFKLDDVQGAFRSRR